MADIEGLIAELTLDEKAALTAGEDLWSTVAIDRLGIPKVRVTDGPNGARGASLPGASDATSVCVPVARRSARHGTSTLWSESAYCSARRRDGADAAYCSHQR